MKINKNIKILVMIVSFIVLVLLFVNFENSKVKNSELLSEIEKIGEATDLIEKNKYVEAIDTLNEIKSVDLYYLKNQHLGDVEYIKGNYEGAISFYNIAQIHAKDKIMYDYISKRVSYIKTVKLKKGA